MRKVLFLAAAFCLVAVSTAQAAADKIAVFNSRAVAGQSEPFTAARNKIETQYAPEKKRIEDQMKRVNSQAEDLQKQRGGMSREAFAEKSEAFLRAKRNVEDSAQSFSRKYETALVRLDQEFTLRLVQAVQEYGARRGFAMILDTAGPTVLYADKSADVTADIIKELARVYREGKPIPQR
jgi:Skp family chaperone for outer membrane proteins